MWVVATLIAVLCVIGVQPLVRKATGLSPMAAVFAAGVPIGGLLLVVVGLVHGVGVQVVAAGLAFAAACELILFLQGMLTTSVAVALLARLKEGPLAAGQVFGSAEIMRQRIAGLTDTGMLEERDGALKITRRGAAIDSVWNACRTWMKRPLMTERKPDQLQARDLRPIRGHGASFLETSIHLALIAGMTIFVFWPYLIGDAVFVGDSDRMNHFLTLKLLQGGELAGWFEYMFAGFSGTSVPAHPNPLMALYELWPQEDYVVAAGYVSWITFLIAGWAAYAFLRHYVYWPVAGLAGAIAYVGSAESVLKISQNDNTFLAIALLPLILLAVAKLQRQSLVVPGIALFALVTLLLTFTFLQKASYVLLLAGTFGIWRLLCDRDLRSKPGAGLLTVWPVALSGLAAFLSGVIASGPKLIEVATELAYAVRPTGAKPDGTFHAMGVQEAINSALAQAPKWTELLRLFDERIFGVTMMEAQELGNRLNLHEGLLLYTSTFMLMAAGLTIALIIVQWVARGRTEVPYGGFFVLTLMALMLVALNSWAYLIVHFLYLQQDFLHGRIILMGLMPLCALGAYGISWIAVPRGHLWMQGQNVNLPSETPWLLFCVSTLLAVLTLATIEYVALNSEGAITLAGIYALLGYSGAAGVTGALDASAVVRIVLSLLVAIGVVVLLLRGGAQPHLRTGIGVFLAVCVIGQVSVFARTAVSGSELVSPNGPFTQNTRLRADADAFRQPTAMELSRFHGEIKRDLFRTEIICPPTVTHIYCTAYMSSQWGLRTAGGYLQGVPTRLAALPWGEFTADPVLSRRSLTFPSKEGMPWKLLGLLNVKSAIVYSPELAANQIADANGQMRRAAFADMEIIQNPEHVVGRVFFARDAVRVGTTEEARQILFDGAGGVQNVELLTVLEAEGAQPPLGLPTEISAVFTPEHMQFSFEPSDKPRVLVVNERHHHRWTAYINGDRDAEIGIVPANMVMRGILVPAGVGQVELVFESYFYSRATLAWWLAAALGLLGSLMVATRFR